MTETNEKASYEEQREEVAAAPTGKSRVIPHDANAIKCVLAILPGSAAHARADTATRPCSTLATSASRSRRRRSVLRGSTVTRSRLNKQQSKRILRKTDKNILVLYVDLVVVTRRQL